MPENAIRIAIVLFQGVDPFLYEYWFEHTRDEILTRAGEACLYGSLVRRQANQEQAERQSHIDRQRDVAVHRTGCLQHLLQSGMALTAGHSKREHSVPSPPPLTSRKRSSSGRKWLSFCLYLSHGSGDLGQPQNRSCL